MNPDTASERLPFWKRDIGDLFSRRSKASSPHGPRSGVVESSVRAVLPQADLLPASIREKIAIRHVRSIALLLAVIILAPAIGIWTLWSSESNSLDRELQNVTSVNTDLQAQVRILTPVESLVRQVEAQRALLEESLAAQPDAVGVLARLAETAADNGPVELDSVNVTYYLIPRPGEPTNPCPDPDPFSEEIAIGCMTFSASTTSRKALSDFLAELENDPYFVGPFVNTSSIAAQVDGQGGDRVTFSGSAGISTEALATPLTAEEIELILNPPESEPASTDGQVSDTGADS